MKNIESEKQLNKFIKNQGHKNLSYMHQRCRIEQSDREKAFSRLWRNDNKKKSWLNSGFGILQDLFFYTYNIDRFKHYPLLIITNRDRVIAATVIQWLGSNVGFSFLQKALNMCGYKIVKK